MGLPPEKSRPKNDIGFVIEDRLHELGVLPRIVFEVCVLNNDHFSGGRGDAGTNRGALSLVYLVKYDAVDQGRYSCRELFAGTILRAIIDNNDFLWLVGGGPDRIDRNCRARWSSRRDATRNEAVTL